MPTVNGATDLNSAVEEFSAALKSEQTSLPTDEQEEEALEVEETSETQESDTKEATEKYKVKVDGEELEVELDELLKGYSREASYRQKTMKHSNEIKVQREAIEAKTNELDNHLSELKTLLDNDYSKEDMQYLKDNDPDLYIKKLDEKQKKQDKFNQLQSKRQAELQSKQDDLIKKEREALLAAFPSWSDAEVQSKEVTEIFKTLEKFGYSSNELQSLTDHRVFVLADMARKLTGIEAAKVTVKDKAKQQPPKSMKPGTPKTQTERNSAKREEIKKRFEKTGSRHDAYMLLTS